MCARLLICIVMIALCAINQSDAVLTMEQIQKTAMTLRNTCISKSHADAEAVEGMQTGQFPEGNQPLKCYTLCVMKAMRTWKGGRIDDGMMIKQLDLMMPADLAGPIKASATACANVSPGSDDCDTTYKFVECCYKNDKDHFFFP
ncbi:general odorant-binding protein 19a-like [Nylanderia fulva]|uniref:general odorant-binding protein 19a-like n=1 Tax=Nylanderia fulva TaxID=613905 RepID=UPI0010FB2504|nr:general odorant-binding protein 19a-like [Nylanderia fulva]XP_029167118.1 general odorant-binding protein 19a-like [Nylanderia fulva]